MTVTHFWNESQKVFPTSGNTINIKEHFYNEDFAHLYILSSALNSTAEVEPPKGSATELAILKLLGKMGENYDELRKKA